MSPASTGRTGDGQQGRGAPERSGRQSGNRSGRDLPRPRPPQEPRADSAEWDDYATPPNPQRGSRPQPGRDPLAGNRDPWVQNPAPQSPYDRDPRLDTGTHILPDSPGVAGRGRRRKGDGAASETGEFPRQGGLGDSGQFGRADRRPGDSGQFPRTDRRPGDTGEFSRPRRPGDTGEFPRPGRRPGDTGEFPRPNRSVTETGQFSRRGDGPASAEDMPWQRQSSALGDDRSSARRPGRPGEGAAGRRGGRHDDDLWGEAGLRRGGVGTLDDDDPWDELDEEPAGWRGRRRAKKAAKRARLSAKQLRFRKNLKLGIAGGMLALLFWLTISIGGALTAPGNEDVQSRLAGWARQHGLGFAVSWMENQKYQMNPPKTGGQLSQQDLNSLTQNPSAEPSLAKNEHVLPPMKLFLPNPAPGEGVWEPATVVNGIPVVQIAKLRSDAVHTSYLSAVAWIDHTHANFVLHPGIQQPGSVSQYNSTDFLSGNQLTNLIATWNGGFMLNPNDAHGGFYLNGKTYGTLVPGQASEVFKKDGSMDVGAWGQPGFTMSDQVVGVRQNLPLLVDNGQVNPSVDSTDKKLWGVTVKNAFFVWRSGVGVTANGDIVYAMGPTLSVRTLAELLQRAGAVRAMELDINQEWVSFMTYDGSKDPANPASTKLLDFARTARRYFSAEDRDFVAAYFH